MFKKIIWGTDGSEAADKALPYVESLARDGGGSVEVVHVVEHLVGGKLVEPVDPEEPELKAKIEKQVADLGAAGVTAELKFVAGRQLIAAHALADAAKESGADVIVVGTRGRTGIGAVVLGSVTHRLLHIAPCPVLAIPAHI